MMLLIVTAESRDAISHHCGKWHKINFEGNLQAEGPTFPGTARSSVLKIAETFGSDHSCLPQDFTWQPLSPFS